jgi:DNA replication licensing factor MCM7
MSSLCLAVPWHNSDLLSQYDDLLEENGTPLNLVASIETNAKHYLDIMAKAVDKVMPEPTREIK